MQQASEFFTKDQAVRIEAAVADAESKTSAEIVPAVATASGRYDRPEDIVGLWAGAAAAAIAWSVFRALPEPESGWGFQWGSLELPAILTALLLGFILGAVAGSRAGWLRRLFTPRTQMCEEVAARAREVFFDKRVHRTQGGTGLLVYVSLFERMAAVLGDESVLAKLGQESLDALCSQLTNGFREGEPCEAFCGVIRAAGERLGEVLPRAQDDVDELANTLVTLDE